MKIAITGTTSGIGLALANSLKSSYEILELNRSDLSSEPDLSNIDILINNAGHALGGGVGFIGHDSEQWRNILDSNLVLPIALTQKFIRQNPKGKIIFITSKAVEMNIGGDSVYSASKSGLSTFIKCLRHELKGSAYKLVEIRPGRVKTNFAKNRQIHSPEILESFYDERLHMDVDEIVTIVKFSISNDSVETITAEK